jgi:CcmD family protein
MGHIHTMLVTLVVWAGLFAYLWRLEKKVSELEEGER